MALRHGEWRASIVDETAHTADLCSIRRVRPFLGGSFTMRILATGLMTLAIFMQAGDQSVDGPSERREDARSRPDQTGAVVPKDDRVLRNSLGMELVRIPPGEFLMGNRDEPALLARAFPRYEAGRLQELEDELPHRVRITKAYYLGAHEVTRGQFQRFVSEAGYVSEPERDGTGGWGYDPKVADFQGRDPRYSWRDPGFVQGYDHPVVNVTWNDAVAFCQWLSRREGRTYRLPTEAEWEYACRAGTTTRYAFGDNPEGLSTFANVFDSAAREAFPAWRRYALTSSDGYTFTAPVGRFRPNAFGLYDMHGNVWEWCSDWYRDDYYAASPVDDPQGPASGHLRSRRGGAWHSFALYVRSSYRNFNTSRSRYPNLGLRVLLEDAHRQNATAGGPER
jgi:formylglycine-generating enzyme required for sulfatase activity